MCGWVEWRLSQSDRQRCRGREDVVWYVWVVVWVSVGMDGYCNMGDCVWVWLRLLLPAAMAVHIDSQCLVGWNDRVCVASVGG